MFLLMSARLGAEWSAPPNPNPGTILREAKSDFRNGRYEDALAKHIWFHNNALDIDRSLFGVRLTTALASWHKLAKVYPPALEMLRESRDQAAKRVVEHEDHNRHAFIDFEAINRHIHEEKETVALFVHLDKEMPAIAAKVYDIAQPALVRAKSFDLCGKYLTPETSYEKMKQKRRMGLEFANELVTEAERRRQRDIVERAFIDESGTLIALLVLNDRRPEAEKIAEDARKQSKLSTRDDVIDAALDAKFPKGVLASN
jgi:hypothetical protein